jgi:hypothetical protein
MPQNNTAALLGCERMKEDRAVTSLEHTCSSFKLKSPFAQQLVELLHVHLVEYN